MTTERNISMKTSIQTLVAQVLSGSASYADIRQHVMSEAPESANAFFACLRCRIMQDNAARVGGETKLAELAAEANADAADLGD